MEAVLKASVTNSYYGEQKSDMKYVAGSQCITTVLTLSPLLEHHPLMS